MTVLYIAFGPNQRLHQQVVFSALSILSWREPTVEIVIFTDYPRYYQILKGVSIRTPQAAAISEWKGPHDYLYRMKIKALQELSQEKPTEHLLFLDGDTFVFDDPRRLSAVMQQGHHLMHAREGALSALPTKTEKKIWGMAEGQTFGGVTVGRHSVMFNSGVIGLSSERASVAAGRALSVCDDMLATDIPKRLVEQLSISLALADEGGVEAADFAIGHYWGNKEEWDHFIDNFFVRHLLEGSSWEDLLAAVRGIDFRAIPIYRKSSSTHRKLTHLIDDLFTKRQHAFVDQVTERTAK